MGAAGISRRDLLDIVRKHSDALPRPHGYSDGPPSATPRTDAGGAAAAGQGGARAEGEASSPELMDGRYWKQMVDMYFVASGLEGSHTGTGKGAGAGTGTQTEGPQEGAQSDAKGDPGPEHVEEGSKGQEGSKAGEGGEDSPGAAAAAAVGRSAKRDALFDDMLFFVRHEKSALGHILNFFGSLMPDSNGKDTAESEEKAKPYFVRRWASDLDKVVGESADEIDWRRSYYLNLICHTEYTLTVAICSRQALDNHRRSHKAAVPPIYKVTKRVYASPSKARIDMDASKAQQTLPSYPQICFAVDDYDDTFDAVVLENPDHCFCVLLNAYGGAAFPQDDTVEKTSADGKKTVLSRGTSSEARALGEAEEGVPKITLFSGFVSYPMVRAAFQGGNAGFALFGTSQTPQQAQTPPKAEKLVMRGPGERGEAEVAVTGVPPPASPPPPSPQDLPGTRPHTASTNGLISEEARSMSSSSSSGSSSGKDKEGGRKKKASLEELQGKLWSVQEQLMAVVQQQQQPQAGGDGAQAESADDPAARRQREEENQKRLAELQRELKSVQEQLQSTQLKSSPKAGSAAANGASGGSGGGIGGFLKRVTAVPPKRAMVHNDEEEGASHAGAGSGGRGKAPQPAVLPLRCCLMSLSLPWDLLAFDLLFKEMPIKVDIGGRIFPPRRPLSNQDMY